MRNVVFVVPFALDTTLRFVRAMAGLDGVRLALVSQETLERVPPEVRGRLAAFERVRDALDPEQLEEAVRRVAREWGGKVDVLVGILEQLQEALAEVRERLGIPGMGRETARNFRDKARMKDILRANGLPCARHHLATGSESALAFGTESGYPLVVKPPAGAGAKHTFRVDSHEQLVGYLKSAPPGPAQPLLLEEFVTGREYSFDSVSLHGRHLFHSITEYWPSPLEVLQTPWIQWCVILPRSIDGPEFAPIREAGPRVLDALGMTTGMTHMEWFLRPGQSIAISEVAARPPGAQFTTLHSHAHDIDFYQAWARLVTLEQFDVPERKYSSGAAFLRGQGSGDRIVDLKGVEQAQRELGDLVVEAKLPRVGQAPAAGYEGEGYVIVRHPETEVVRDALTRLLRMLRVELG